MPALPENLGMRTPTPPVPQHSPVEDLVGLATGAFVASVGLFLLDGSGIVTGGTAGLALLLAKVVPLGFGALYLALSLPFVALAVTRKGWSFTLRSGVAVAAVSALSDLHPRAVDLVSVDPVYAAFAGNLAIGLGILIIFRHGASLGGFNIVALIAQEQWGWRAGYVQLTLDLLVIAGFAFVGTPTQVALSVAGAAVLNLILALNHRPGRYPAADAAVRAAAVRRERDAEVSARA